MTDRPAERRLADARARVVLTRARLDTATEAFARAQLEHEEARDLLVRAQREAAEEDGA